MNKTLKTTLLAAAITGALSGPLAVAGSYETEWEKQDAYSFKMVPSAGVSKCLPYARARVTLVNLDGVELMQVAVSGLPPETKFDFFVTQLPNPPFGLSWYQGDIETNKNGRSRDTFIGRFNEETFVVAVGSGPAPQVHDGVSPDAAENPVTDPVHTYHLGLWFNSPEDAAAAGCPDIVTPFNGEHHAGIQVLTTSNFPDLAGPLSKLKP